MANVTKRLATFAVIYRTGGTENFRWVRVLDIFDRDGAQAQKAELERAGYPALIHNARLLDSVGMPDTYDVDDTRERIDAFLRLRCFSKVKLQCQECGRMKSVSPDAVDPRCKCGSVDLEVASDDSTYYEDAMARKTGSTVEQMRKEQAEFEKRLTANDQVLLKDNGSEPTPRR